jgi:hypothetical protein
LETEDTTMIKTTKRIQGHAAIALAERHDLTLWKHRDPVDRAREELSVEEAREIAHEDPSLVYIDLDASIPAVAATRGWVQVEDDDTWIICAGARYGVMLTDDGDYAAAYVETGEPAGPTTAYEHRASVAEAIEDAERAESRDDEIRTALEDETI